MAKENKPRPRRVFVDLDGVVVDFKGYMLTHDLTSDEVKQRPGAYLEMDAYPDALGAVRSLIGMGFEVWIATKPPTGVPHAYSDKAQWVMFHLPELQRRIIITHDKGLLGDDRDFLIDDRPHKANCENFRGTLIDFGTERFQGWPEVLEFFRGVRRGVDVTGERRRALALAEEIAAAVASDEHGEGCDVSAGMFGPVMSELIRRLARVQAHVDTVADAAARESHAADYRELLL